MQKFLLACVILMLPFSGLLVLLRGQPGAYYMLAFYADGGLYLALPDGSSPRHLTDVDFYTFEWSPDGAWLLFIQQGALQKIRINGQDKQRLPDQLNGLPTFAPDGVGFVFSGDNRNLLYARQGIEDAVQIMRQSIAPHWSPDGSALAVEAFTYQWNVHVVGVDGSAAQQLTTDSGYQPQWSPDGNWIGYYAVLADRYRLAFLRVHPDGTGRERIAQLPDTLTVSTVRGRLEWFWLSDGESAIFEGLYKLTLDDGAWLKLGEPDGRFPSLSPDGLWLAYAVENRRVNRCNIYRIQPDGTANSRLTDRFRCASYPRWSPLLGD